MKRGTVIVVLRKRDSARHDANNVVDVVRA